MNESPWNISSLPSEIKQLIIELLDGKSTVSLSRVSMSWNRYIITVWEQNLKNKIIDKVSISPEGSELDSRIRIHNYNSQTRHWKWISTIETKVEPKCIAYNNTGSLLAIGQHCEIKILQDKSSV